MDCFRQFSFIDQNQVSELDMNFLTLMGFSGDNFFSRQVSSDFSGDVVAGMFHHAAGENLAIVDVPADPVGPASSSQVNVNVVAVKSEETEDTKKRKAGDASPNSSPATSSGKNSCRGVKKTKMNDEKLGKDVVHVRARRGQATDSHSLAERARRGKINERLKCLQDIVPGCYKTMGMAMMLDEIINYVQSLQNQVEFLSMKLTAASSFYDFNSDSNVTDLMQRAKAEEMEGVMREEYGGVSSCFNSTTTSIWPH